MLTKTSLSALLLLVVLASSCTSDRGEDQGERAGAGGTLRVVMLNDANAELDPQKEYSSIGFELFRCCLLRTLMSTNGLPTDRGGSVLRPDIAEAPPDVSRDGLTWTFRLKHGLHYAPPLQDTEITASDVIRALEREATPVTSSNLPYGFYYSVIAGFDDFTSGKAQRIIGLKTPDPYTLVVELNQPTGDLGYRFSLPATAPIPPLPNDASAVFGAAEGHDNDYGRHLVASGPYMLAGSADLDPSLPPEQQPAVAGYRPGVGIQLVRDTSWLPETDLLRPALADVIDIEIQGPTSDLFGAVADDVLDRVTRKVVEGRSDVLFDVAPTSAELDRLTSRGETAGLVKSDPANQAIYFSMNLAVPPFDDVHVRRAVNLAIDRTGVVEAFHDAGVEAQPALHAIPDSMEGGRLEAFAPFDPTPDIAGARHEMTLSPYGGSDGRCHAAACRHVEMYPRALGSGDAASRLARDLRAIGIVAKIAECCPDVVYGGSPKAHTAAMLWGPWSADFTDASGFFVPLFYGQGIAGAPTYNRSNYNTSLLGASAAQLRRWGYAVDSVPDMDDAIDTCLPQIGEQQVSCWATLDQRLTTVVAPVAPLVFPEIVRVVSPRVRSYAFDQSAAEPSLDRIGLS